MNYFANAGWRSRRTHLAGSSLGSGALVLLLAATLACQAPAAPAPAPQAPGAPSAAQPSGAPIKIGALLSTTGGLAPFGNDSLPGAQVFVDEINAKGGINGRPIQLIHLDDESKPDQTVTNAKRLIQQDHVVAFVGPVSQSVTSAAMPVIADAKLVSLSCGCQYGAMEPYQFSTFPTIGMQKSNAALAKSHGLTEIAIIAQAGALADIIKATNVPDIEKEGIKILTFEQFQPTDTDLTPVLAKVRSMGAKQVYVAASGVQAAIAAKNFKQMSYPGYYWTFAGNANDTFINLVGDAADIVTVAGTKILVYRDLPASDPDKARLADFAAKYHAKTGREPGTYAAFFYDNMASLADAIQHVGTDSQKIRDYLETQSGLQVLNGTINRSAAEHNGLIPVWQNVGIDPVAKRFVIKPA